MAEETRVLLSEEAWDRHRPRLEACGSNVIWLRQQADGSIAVPEGSSAEPIVGWITFDLAERESTWQAFTDALRAASSLQWLHTSSAGVDLPLYDELMRNGVRVTGSHIFGVPIAEFVLRAVLDHFQGGDEWRTQQARRAWQPHEFREVAGTTWLVVGMGGIGTGVALRARSLGARVVGVRRRIDGNEPADEMVAPAHMLERVGDADVVVLAIPATAATIGLVDEEFLARMRPRSVLVNIARGSLIDEKALLAALDRGVPEAAVLDVFATEPLPSDDPLWSHPRVVATPHNSALTPQRWERAAEAFCEHLSAWLAGRR